MLGFVTLALELIAQVFNIGCCPSASRPDELLHHILHSLKAETELPVLLLQYRCCGFSVETRR